MRAERRRRRPGSALRACLRVRFMEMRVRHANARNAFEEQKIESISIPTRYTNDRDVQCLCVSVNVHFENLNLQHLAKCANKNNRMFWRYSTIEALFSDGL